MPCCCSDPLQASGMDVPAQGQAGWSPGQPDLVDGIPAHWEGWELGDLKGPFQAKPFCGLGETVKAHSSSWCTAYLC